MKAAAVRRPGFWRIKPREQRGEGQEPSRAQVYPEGTRQKRGEGKWGKSYTVSWKSRETSISKDNEGVSCSIWCRRLSTIRFRNIDYYSQKGIQNKPVHGLPFLPSLPS